MISVRELYKTYGNSVALDHISFDVKKNELFGFIGPDGAGKTSLFRIIASLLLPDSGEVLVGGTDVVKEYRKIRNLIGYMPGRFSLYSDLTVEENLNFFAGIFGTTIKENLHLINEIYSQISPFKDRPAGKLSGGMKQKLALSCAMIHKPELLILDEPTTGVDAVSRKEFWEMLKHLKNEGITIIVSTPYMDEAGMCDRVALIQTGKIMSIETPEVIVNNYGMNLFAVRTDKMTRLPDILMTMPGAFSACHFGQFVHFTHNNNSISAGDISVFLTSSGFPQPEVRQIKASIEDCFMKLMINND